MSASGSATTEASANGAAVTSAGPLLVVDVAKKQTSKNIRSLRKGRGKLFDKITDLVEEMKSNGTLTGEVQPLVIVVRQKKKRSMLGW